MPKRWVTSGVAGAGSGAGHDVPEHEDQEGRRHEYVAEDHQVRRTSGVTGWSSGSLCPVHQEHTTRDDADGEQEVRGHDDRM